MIDLESVLRDAFPQAKIEVRGSGDEYTAWINDLDILSRADLEVVEDKGYLIEDWEFECAGGGRMIMHLRRLDRGGDQ